MQHYPSGSEKNKKVTPKNQDGNGKNAKICSVSADTQIKDPIKLDLDIPRSMLSNRVDYGLFDCVVCSKAICAALGFEKHFILK